MIGEIEGIEPGHLFKDRRELHDARVHRGLQQGIGAGGESIVVSGGYVDDVDDGDTIIYTGEGGRDNNTGRQIEDQALTRGNLALVRNYRQGNPIRVSRGHNLDSPHAPATGYRYDGLYCIENCWHEKGVDGFRIWRFRLVQIPPSEQLSRSTSAPPRLEMPQGANQPGRSGVYTTRVIRNSEVGNYVKSLYGYTCQISGVRLDTPGSPYAESCHIKPVGKPHNGPDVVGNVLCLSPNMHVLFDLGAIALTDELEVLGLDAQLTVDPAHKISIDCVRYHREHIYQGEGMLPWQKDKWVKDLPTPALSLGTNS